MERTIHKKQGVDKLLSLSLSLILLFFISSCKTDLGDVLDRLDDHENRLKAFENEIKAANGEISKLEGLLQAQAGKKTILSYKELEDKSGFELLMSDNSKIVLKNGEKGESSAINVKTHTDGALYWTLNNEFMKDADGKMIKAKGSDAVAPKLRVNTKKQWETSTDNGKTWQVVTGENGEPVSAVGAQGENPASSLEITESQGVVIIKYKGVTYTIKKNSANGEEPSTEILKLPIEYVAEYNVNEAGDGFVTDHSNTTPGLFSWYEAMGVKDTQCNPTGKKITAAAAFKNYHLPTHAEWRCVMPDVILDNDPGPGEGKVVKDAKEEITVGKTTQKYTADYDRTKPVRSGQYGIRFKGNGDKFKSAYRYRYEMVPGTSYWDKQNRVVITVRHLGPGSNITLEQITKEEFWKEKDAKYITRYFPTSGYATQKDSTRKRAGEQALHWSATENLGDYKEKYAIAANFYDRHFDVTTNAYSEKIDKYALRLFLNN